MQTTSAWRRAALDGAPSRRHAVWGTAVTAAHHKETVGMQTTIAWCRAVCPREISRPSVATDGGDWGGSPTQRRSLG